MFKKIVLVVVILFLAITSSACGKGENGPASLYNTMIALSCNTGGTSDACVGGTINK